MGETAMIDGLDQNISKKLRATNALLAFAILLGLVPVTTPSAQAQTFTDLHDFIGSDGGLPQAGLVRDSKGNLYGTTTVGGSVDQGVVFKVDASGHESVLHTFTAAPTDGGAPHAALIRDKAGNLYGTTTGGGAYGAGTVFKLSNTRKFTLLYSFTGGSDGAAPYGGVIQDNVGNLYGDTQSGGNSTGLGVVFKLSKTGKLTVLHNFSGPDGANPYLTSLIMDAKGNLYGVTQQGGASNFGVVYRVSKSGKFTLLHSFAGGTGDGCEAMGTPAMDKAGNLYGTTEACGSSSEGTVWKLSKNGSETVLHNFDDSDNNDGAFPYAGVIMDAKGNLYGDTQVGGIDYGTVYELSPDGAITILHDFVGGSADGANPYGGLIRDAPGNLYGTTQNGGNNYGTVWKLAP